MTKKICPLCNGEGKIRNPKDKYGGRIICPNCQGEGFVGLADNPFIKNKFDIYMSKK